jgi:hypothetical protein
MLTKILWMFNSEAWNRSELTTAQLQAIKAVIKQAIQKRGE